MEGLRRGVREGGLPPPRLCGERGARGLGCAFVTYRREQGRVQISRLQKKRVLERRDLTAAGSRYLDAASLGKSKQM